MHDRFAARGPVDQAAVGRLLEPAAAALGEQRDQVDEGEPEAAQHGVLAGGDALQLGGDVGGVGGRQVEAAVPGGEGGVGVVTGVGVGFEVAEGEDDVVGGQYPVGEVDQLRTVRRALDPLRGVPVDGDRDVRRQVGDGAPEHPVQIGALGPPGGEVGGREGAQLGPQFGVGDLPVGGELLGTGGPFGERGAGADRPVEGRALVGEHGDVLRHRVHPQQRGLLVAPDPAAAGRVRVDQVDVQRPVGGQQFGGVGGYPLQHPGAARPGADDDQDGAHRASFPVAVPPVSVPLVPVPLVPVSPGAASSATARSRRYAARARCSGVGGRPSRVAPFAKWRST